MTHAPSKEFAAAPDDSELAAIRALMAQQGDTPPPVARKIPVVQAARPDPALARKAAPSVAQVQPTNVAPSILPEGVEKPMTRLRTPEWVTEAVARVLAYRPTARHLALVTLALIVVLRPWVVVSFSLLLAGSLIGTFLFLGADRFWRKLLTVISWVGARHPQVAVDMRMALDRAALRWDAFLDRFPDGWVDGLYMPDFRALAQADELHAAAMTARLERLRDETTA